MVSPICKKIKDFLEDSKYFAGVTMQGMYAMSIKDFLLAFEHYLETNENVLDEHAEITWLDWEINDFKISNEKEADKYEKYIEKKTFWELNKEQLLIVERALQKFYEKQKTKSEYINRRNSASLFTSDSKVRKLVFEAKGKKCCICGSEDNLTIDHIIPVKNGGKDELNNFQILCKSCNSKKGCKVLIDKS